MFGVTIPFRTALDGLPRHADELAGAGYQALWTAETAGADAFGPLLLAAAHPNLHLGTAVASVFARSPALLAMSAAALAEAAPGRTSLGLGASSAGMVEGWHDRAYRRPYQRVVDTVRFLRRAFVGERIRDEFETFAVRGFALDRPPVEPPRILLAALREKMLAAAGAEADGVILNWLGPDDVPTVIDHVRAARPIGAADPAAVARIFVCPSDDPDATRRAAKRFLAGYLTVPVYEAYHRWLGRGDALAECFELWAAGQRDAAVRAIPDEVVNDLIGIGDPAACAAHVRRYVEQGVTEPVVKVLPLAEGLDERRAAIDVAQAYVAAGTEIG